MTLFKKNIKNRLFYPLVIVFLFIFSCSPPTQTKKIYSLYPEIWGYDLSEFPAMKWGLAGVETYAMDNGDFWFFVDYFYKNTNPMEKVSIENKQYILIKFFKGEKLKLTLQEKNKLVQVIEGKKLSLSSLSSKIEFKDGSTLETYNEICPKLCFVPDFFLDYLIKTDTHGKAKKYSILVASPQVDIYLDEGLCEENAAPFLYQKLHTLHDLILLKDDTFIAFDMGSSLILRFDKQLKTKFKPVSPTVIHYNDYISRNFFVIDYSLIENLHKKFIDEEVPLYQSIHDALLQHFHKLYK